MERGDKVGKKPIETTLKFDHNNEIKEVSTLEVVGLMACIKSCPETDYGYRAMSAALCLLGYIINHIGDQKHRAKDDVL